MQTEPPPAVGSIALLGLSALVAMPEPPPVSREIFGPGICDLCGEHSPALKEFAMQPATGIYYCRKCAPLRETDEDWPKTDL